MTDCRIQLHEGVPTLSTFYVYLTGGCNLACKHCWIAPTYQAHGDTGGHVDYDLLVKAIKEGLPLGLNHIKLTGGEPLLHPDFIRIVDFIREKELGLSIETNGTLLTASLAKYLRKKSTLSAISVSLDGATSEVHDTFRGVKGSFDKTCQAVRFLVDEGYRPQVIMSLYAGNVDQIEDLVYLAHKLGAGSVKFNIIQPSGRGELLSERQQTLSLEKLIEIGRWIETDFRKRVPIHLVYSWPMAFFSINRLNNFQGYSCEVKNILGILSSGHLALCGIGTAESELVYGKIGEVPLEQIWINNPRLIDLRKSIPSSLQGVCGDCIVRDQCKGMCIAQNYHVSGHLTAPFWFCDEADKLGLFPSTRKKRRIA